MRMIPFQFINPAVPRLRERPPEGEEWPHEVKFDGWRVQLHKVGREIIVFSKNGHDITRRCRWITEVSTISARSLIIDGELAELAALDSEGRPDFDAIGRRGTAATLCAFDLLELNGRDLRALPLVERRRRLKVLSAKAPTHMVFSEDFANPFALLAQLEHLAFEGIVSKRVDTPYRSGTACGWVKVKTESWRERH